jgi:single-stranded-DNA-specific exonuclease
VASPAPTFILAPYDYAEARALERELGVAEPVAVALVRRGYRTPDAARAFLAADEVHDPFRFAAMAEVVERLRSAAAARRRITIHGDYDVDGTMATAICVRALRELGADCDWYIPSRLEDGYGLTAATLERLRARGTELLVTVDCGIASASEVEGALAAGIEVVVTDHHQPPDALPRCPVLHPVVSGYPCRDLCATGVAYKLAVALHGSDWAEPDLDLVALATVVDIVPLRDENRALVRRGLRVARRALRPGLRALCAAAGVEPQRLDEGDLAFRLGPRINAAGRLYRADGAVELMLTADEGRAEAIAADLDRANRERRDAEGEVLAAAERTRAELPEDLAALPGLVLAGEGWHAGVVGIVASRLAERHLVPTILIGLGPDGRGRGSGRSVPGFDLLAALRDCDSHLLRYGGHRAAAGLEIEAGAIESFRRSFCERAAAALGPEPPSPREEIDAVVGCESLGLEVAEQLGRLGPFGAGNPEVRLLVPGARLADVRPMGSGERHARFTLASGPRRALGVAFGVNGELAAAAAAERLDVSVGLEVNQWNGALEPRVVLGTVYSPPSPASGELPRPDEEEWWGRVDAELATRLDRWPRLPEPPSGEGRRETVDRRGHGGIAGVAALASAGGAVLVVACDALRRRELVERAAAPARFGGGRVAVASARLATAPVSRAVAAVLEEGGVVLTDWGALAADPALACRFEHVVAIDPPPAPDFARLLECGLGFLHLLWSEAHVDLACRAHEAEWPTRAVLAAVYRALCDGGQEEVAPGVARAALSGPSPHERSPEAAARCLRVLLEVGLAATVSGRDRALRVVSSPTSELERSPVYAAYRARSQEGIRFLSRRQAS